MIDHLTMKVRDLQRSINFYSKALASLGYVAKAHHEPTIGFGAEDDGNHSDFYLTPSEDGMGSPVTHIAFRAADSSQVDAFLQRGDQGWWSRQWGSRVARLPSEVLLGLRSGSGREQCGGRGGLVGFSGVIHQSIFMAVQAPGGF